VRASLPIALSLFLLAACDSSPRHEPVVVYVAGGESATLAKRFALFTQATGIPVTQRFGESNIHTNSVIENRGSPPADLLLTDNIADIWRAADQGALRPIASKALATMPGYLRDPDGMWIALDYRLAVIAKHSTTARLSPSSYVELAEPAYKGKLCLVSSRLPRSRMLIAMLIDDLGRRPAELVVRKWVRNLASPPFESDLALLEAVRAGVCQYGIVSSAYTHDAISVIPVSAYYDIDGIGIVRHARYPESAQRLMHWLVTNNELDIPTGASRHNIGVAGWRDEEAVLLAERASYR
jgi:iron(III) transport system substrate-binding protein